MGLSSVTKLLSICCLVPCFVAPSGTPEETVTAFVDAWNAKDLKKAAGLVVGADPNRDFKELNDMFHGDWIKVTVTDLQGETTGDKAKATFHIKLEAGSQPIPERDESVDLEKVGDDWRLVPLKPQPQANGPENYLSTLAMLVTDTTIFTKASHAAKSTVCLSNVKQITLAALMLATDNDDVFKLDPAQAKATLSPYIKNDQVWICPEAGTVAYRFNTYLANRSANSIKDVANTVLVYEGDKGKLAFRHEGRAAVGFADGHAKLIDAEQAKKLIWKP